MSHGIYTAAAGAVARQTELDVVANNLANVSTDGFRAVGSSFEEVLNAATSQTRRYVAVGAQRLAGTRGPLSPTGDDRDVALDGPGFFSVVGPAGDSLLARTLSLRVSADGIIRDTRGLMVAGAGGALRADPRAPFSVARDGAILQAGREVGRLRIVDVPNAGALAPAAGGLYLATDDAGPLDESRAEVLRATREGSNVAPIECMVNLVRLSREFEALMRAVQAHGEADERVTAAADGRRPG